MHAALAIIEAGRWIMTGSLQKDHVIGTVLTADGLDIPPSLAYKLWVKVTSVALEKKLKPSPLLPFFEKQNKNISSTFLQLGRRNPRTQPRLAKNINNFCFDDCGQTYTYLYSISHHERQWFYFIEVFLGVGHCAFAGQLVLLALNDNSYTGLNSVDWY